jgi:hypothetical protein
MAEPLESSGSPMRKSRLHDERKKHSTCRSMENIDYCFRVESRVLTCSFPWGGIGRLEDEDD